MDEVQRIINDVIAEHCDSDDKKHAELLSEMRIAISESVKPINFRLDEVMPTIREINNMRNAWKYVGVFGINISKLVVTIGVIIGAIYAIKEWIKK